MTIKIQSILKKLLHDRDMTVAQLSRATKVPQQTLSNWIQGQEPRNLVHIKTVADYFKITVDYLVYGVDQTLRQTNPINELSDEINAGVFEVVLKRVKR